MTARRTVTEAAAASLPLLRRSLHAIHAVILWLERRNQRLTLAELTDEQLDDIGLSRRDVERECRPFWKR
ncbi:DUF1127 domain-containing protein [Mesorhizobium sp. WSM2239]|uniref:DUF1127 domain-containing protein n=2 Tax=unclassified Mesorhizobium TaxID=325217 RepID=A0AAU8D9Z7_9HYPH